VGDVSRRETLLREVASISVGVLLGAAIVEKNWRGIACFLVLIGLHLWQRVW
jgi:hypothetical protein